MKQLLNSFPEGLLHEINEELDDLSDLHDLIEAAIMDEPPLP